MSVYPHTSATIAAELADLAADPLTSREELTARIQKEIEKYACAAAGIIHADSKSPLDIERLVWYKSDGWEHGGSAMTWKDQVEEKQAEIEELEKDFEKLRQDYQGEVEMTFSLLSLLYHIRVAAGDKEGRLMQDELVESIRKQSKEAELARIILNDVKDAMSLPDDETHDFIHETLREAQRLGVGNVQLVEYNPNIHGHIEEAEPGTQIWWWGGGDK